MRFRLLAFFPIAIGLALGFAIFASSFVSAVEQAAENKFREDQIAWISVNLLESECAALHREIHALSHEITSCGEDPLCLGSPILCPAALDSKIDREYERLRSRLNERCGVPLKLMDYAWGGPAWGGRAGATASSDDLERGVDSSGWRQGLQSSSDWGNAYGRDQCGATHDWLESAASGHSEASQFYF